MAENKTKETAASGREGEMCLTGFSPRKQDLTLYLMGAFDEREALSVKSKKAAHR